MMTMMTMITMITMMTMTMVNMMTKIHLPILVPAHRMAAADLSELLGGQVVNFLSSHRSYCR